MFKAIFLAVAVSAVGIHSAAFQSDVISSIEHDVEEPLNSGNMIQRFMQITRGDGEWTSENNAKGLELIKDLDGQGIYSAITDGLYYGNTTMSDVNLFIGDLVGNKVLTKKMLLDFTMDGCRNY